MCGENLNSAANTTKPAMCSGGHVLVITLGFRQASLGSAVVMRNLVSQFSPESFTVLTMDVPTERSAPIPPDIRVRTIRTEPPFTRRGERFWRDLAQSLIERRIRKIVRQVQPALILAVYPTLHAFAAAIGIAEADGIPWVAYLHDTLVEPHSGTKYERLANDAQRRMSSSAKAVLVTGRGMADLYRAKHAIDCTPIEIGYCESISETLSQPPGGDPCAFMGGSIYNVNDKAVARLVNGAEQVGIRFRLATQLDWSVLEKHGIARRSTIEKVHYLVRSDYLLALNNQHILTVALNWPQESAIPEDELATAFPTKVVEYLASGRPIVVHCPEHYFLARFFREHDCGIVVSTREAAAISAAFVTLSKEGTEQDRMRKNALRAAKIFSIDRLSIRMKETLDKALGGSGRDREFGLK